MTADIQALADREAGGCTYRTGRCVCPAPPLAYEGCEVRAEFTDWSALRNCPTCGAQTGRVCTQVQDKATGAPLLALRRPHVRRRWLKASKRR